MLKFPEGFFQGETRNEFYIEPMMKRAWAAELEILSEVIAICKKYQITYYADYGTLLGAIRHQGFVPWDDDIDIALLRPDYERLFQILPKELPKSYGINNFYTTENHRQPWGSVTNAQYISIDEARTEKFYGCPYIVGIDIYPLDYIPRDPELAETHRYLYNAVYDAAQRFDELSDSGELEMYLPQLEQLCNVSLKRDETLCDQLWKLSDSISKMFTAEESDEVGLTLRRVLGEEDFRLKKEWYASVIEMPFENIMVDVPVGFDEILTNYYGEYKIPVNCGGAHDYPFYARQEEILRTMSTD